MSCQDVKPSWPSFNSCFQLDSMWNPSKCILQACFTVCLSPWSSQLSSSLPLGRHDIFHPALNLHARPRKGSRFQNKWLLSATVNIFEHSSSWKMHGILTHNFASGNMWLLRWSPTGSLRINLHDISFSTLHGSLSSWQESLWYILNTKRFLSQFPRLAKTYMAQDSKIRNSYIYYPSICENSSRYLTESSSFELFPQAWPCASGSICASAPEAIFGGTSSFIPITSTSKSRPSPIMKSWTSCVHFEKML